MSLSVRRSHTFLDHMGTHAHAHHFDVRHDRAKRYESDRTLRRNALRRLNQAREGVDDAVRRCREKETQSGVDALERIRAHLDRVAERLRTIGWDTDIVPHSWAFHPKETDAIFVIDQAVHDLVNRLVDRFETRAVDHDFLANLREDLRMIERKLDDRTIAIQSIFRQD